MAQNAKKANATGRNHAVPAAKVEAESVNVPATSTNVIGQPEVSKSKPTKARVVRGHKYDGKVLGDKGLDVKLEAGKAPNGPRGNGKPSVMYRIFQIMAETPKITMSEAIKVMQGQKWEQHPTQYGKVDEISPLWCRDYIKGAIAKGFIKVVD